MKKKFLFLLDKIGKKISEEHLIVFDRRSMFFIIACAALFVFAVAFKMNYSSIGKWNGTIKDEKKDISSALLGSPKGIRSDEWLVQTPSMLSQYNNNFTEENPAIGAGKAPLVYNLPVRSFSVFHPQFWGFFVLDFDRGFSFYWNFKVFGLLIGFFLLLMLLTKNNFWLSVAGSLWLLFSGFIQWWFSVVTTEMIATFCFIFIAFAYLFFSKKIINNVIASVALAVFLPNFIFYLYPPFQISLVYLSLFLFFGYSIGKWSFIKNNWKSKAILFLSAIFFTGLMAYFFYNDAKDTILSIQNTEYPGRRVTVGGNMTIGKYFSGTFDTYYTEGKFPKNLGNVCEASNFIILFPVILIPVLIGIYKRKKINPVLLSVLTYLIFISAWMFFGLSRFIEKITLLNMVPTERALIGLGVGSIIAVIVYLSEKSSWDLRLKIKWIPVLAAIIFVAFFFLNKDLGNFLKTGRMIFLIIFFTFLIFWLFNKNRILFGIAIVSFVLYFNHSVNPVVSGIKPVTEKSLYKFFVEMKKQDPDSKWVVFGDRKIADFGKSSGIYFVDGVKYVPNLKLMDSIAGNLESRNIYNRYAHIKFDSAENETVNFDLRQSDLYAVSINPCSEKLKEADIKYFVSKDDNIEKYDCLDLINQIGNVKIFKRIN